MEKDKKDKKVTEPKEQSELIETPIVKIEARIPVIQTREMDKITGRFLVKPAKATWLKKQDPQHDGSVMFSRTLHYFSPERTRDAGGLIKTGLSAQLQAELEEAMDLKKGSLSPYNKDFWANYWPSYPRIPREGLVIDCDRSAQEKLHYCLLRASSKVALSLTDALDKPEAEYVMVSEEREAEISNKKYEIKTKAFKRFAVMSITEQMDFLKVFEEGKFKITKSASPDFIASTLGKVVDENPAKFLEVIEDKNFKAMVFLQDCLGIKAITKAGTKYYVNGTDLIGNTFLDTIINLQNPEYQEVVISLKAKLESLNR